jgi:hypothetical protein
MKKTIYGFKTNRPKIVSEESECAHGHYEIHYYINDEIDLRTNYFGDDCRARKGYVTENLSLILKLALHIIHDQRDKLSLKKRRLRAAYDINYLQQLNDCLIFVHLP